MTPAGVRLTCQTTNHIRPLCRHYNGDVREAALCAASRFGLGNVAQYDPRTDLGQRIEQWLVAVLMFLPDKVPAGSKWCRFTIPADWCDSLYSAGEKDAEVCGWLVGEEGNAYRMIDWTGRPRIWNRKKPQLRPDSLEDFSERMVKIREKYNSG